MGSSHQRYDKRYAQEPKINLEGEKTVERILDRPKHPVLFLNSYIDKTSAVDSHLRAWMTGWYKFPIEYSHLVCMYKILK